jgi:hypothetical protein
MARCAQPVTEPLPACPNLLRYEATAQPPYRRRSRKDLEHHSIAGGTAKPGGPVKIPRGIPDDSPVRVGPVGPAHEAIQHRRCARLAHLEYRTRVVETTEVRIPVEVPVDVADQTADRVRSVDASEAKEHRFLAGAAQLEDHSLACE